MQFKVKVPVLIFEDNPDSSVIVELHKNSGIVGDVRDESANSIVVNLSGLESQTNTQRIYFLVSFNFSIGVLHWTVFGKAKTCIVEKQGKKLRTIIGNYRLLRLNKLHQSIDYFCMRSYLNWY